MTLRLLAAIAMIASCSSAAWSDEDKKDTLEGTWLASKAELGGTALPEEFLKAIKLDVKGENYTVTLGPQTDKGTCKLDPAAKPKAVDITGVDGPNKGKTILAIYERDGDTLRICYELGAKGRPTEFKTTTGSRLFLAEYQLQKP
ncbi:TIGR03067 domain-containing protein [Paludisphaera mucosa]|uniref:TIGR03067 domain-containing protein n=1 Tax=Paludisphaera mucosa TaxID=3030827 RepID=A0ABT6F7X6_9BACT|nr:TIGR03067 domain-containing protein [Paludisphaera mucosa]MDG3003665.1 TIGR03067 domain-containing protein [Paludisphaera mucosa]